MSVFNVGLDLLRDIETMDLRWLLLQGTGYVFDADDAVLADLSLGSNEVSVSGYTRITVSGASRTVDNTNDRITYAADDPDFGTLSTGESVTGLLGYLHVTDDSDSVPIALKSFTGVDTAAIDPFVVQFSGGVIAYVDMA